MKMVLQKFIAMSGCSSRRQAEEMIRNGRVKVNGRKAELGLKVGEADEVEIGNKKIVLANKPIYIKLNKPAGYVCTSRRFRSEKNVFDLVKIKERLFAAGRLDKDSRGLVLLTNDGALAARLTHPRYEHEKEYLVKARGRNFGAKNVLKKFKEGVEIGEGDCFVKAEKIKHLGGERFEIILTQGKKRQIKRMFKAAGYEVADLIRTRIGHLKLGGLGEGRWEYLSEEEIKNLK